MKNCFSLLMIIVWVGCMLACTTNSSSPSGNAEVVLREPDLQAVDVEVPVDTLEHGPFNKQVSSYRTDDNGGYEEYRLTMNLYKEEVSNGQGGVCFGTLVLFVKTPDNTDGVEVARRIIGQVESIEGDTVLLHMRSSEERPQTFTATLVYNPSDYTYLLDMSAPGSLEDLIENRIILQ